MMRVEADELMRWVAEPFAIRTERDWLRLVTEAWVLRRERDTFAARCDRLDEVDETLRQENEELREGLAQALRQWRSYANDSRQFEPVLIEHGRDAEAHWFRDVKGLLEKEDA